MMKFENTELQTSFVVPDALSVRDVLRYDGAVDTMAGADLYERLWAGARAIVQEWQAPIALDADLSTLTDLSAVDVVKFTGLACFSAVREAKATPKN